MKRNRKLIVILVDGMAADYVERNMQRLPHLSELSARGTSIRRLGAAMPGVSVPGRVTMLTGVGVEQHRVYGNHVLEDGVFRRATPYDSSVASIANVAQAAGLSVASVGFGMVRPEDTAVYLPPWWVRNQVKGDQFAKIPEDFLRYAKQVKDPGGKLAAMLGTDEAAEITGDWKKARHSLALGFAGDQRNMRATALLANSEHGPDVILTEVLMPDTVQHELGYETEAGHMSLAIADLMIGSLLHQLENSPTGDDYIIAVTSDHGHSPIDSAFYPATIIPDAICSCEGGTLNVALRNSGDRERYAAALAPFGIEPLDSGYLPAELRESVVTFIAPPRHSFEERPTHIPQSQPSGAPHYISSHGFQRGHATDDRFCVIAGPGVPKGVVERAEADQFAPTLAALMGLEFPHRTGAKLDLG